MSEGDIVVGGREKPRTSKTEVRATLPLAVISFAPNGARAGWGGGDSPTACAMGYILSALPGLNWATIMRVFR